MPHRLARPTILDPARTQKRKRRGVPESQAGRRPGIALSLVLADLKTRHPRQRRADERQARLVSHARNLAEVSGCRWADSMFLGVDKAGCAPFRPVAVTEHRTPQRARGAIDKLRPDRRSALGLAMQGVMSARGTVTMRPGPARSALTQWHEKRPAAAATAGGQDAG